MSALQRSTVHGGKGKRFWFFRRSLAKHREGSGAVLSRRRDAPWHSWLCPTPKRLIWAAVGALLGALLTLVIMQPWLAHQDPMQVHRGHLARLDAMSGSGRVVFLGSSTFQALDVSAVTPLALNLSSGGDTLDSLFDRAARYRSVSTARAVVFNIGLNDSIQACASISRSLWKGTLNLVPHGVPVVVVGLQFPEAPDLMKRCDGHLLHLVAQSNDTLREMCADRDGCQWVTNPAAAHGPSGHGQPLLSDGLHLNRAGYTQLVAAIRAALPRDLRATHE